MVAICRAIRSNCVDPVIQCHKRVFQFTKEIAVRIWTAVSNFFQNIVAAIQQAVRTCMGFKRIAPVQPPINQDPVRYRIEDQPRRPVGNWIRLPNGEMAPAQPEDPVNPINQANGAQAIALEVRERLKVYQNLPIRRDDAEVGLIELYTNQKLYQSGLLGEEVMNEAKGRAQHLSPDSSIAFLRHTIDLYRASLNAAGRVNFDKQLGELSDEVLPIIPSLCIRALIFTPDNLQNHLDRDNVPLILKDKRLIKGEVIRHPNQFFQTVIKLRDRFMNLPDGCKKVVLDRRTVGDGEAAISNEARDIIHQANAIAAELGQGHLAYDQVLMKTLMA